MSGIDAISSSNGKPLTILFGTNYKVGQTGHFACTALERMGHNVIPFTPTKNAPDDWLKVAPDVDAPELLKSCGATPDIFLMVESSTGTPFLPKRLADIEIPTAYWMYDNYLNFRWNKEAAALFDYCFFAQVNRMKLARRYGRKNIHWLPFAADEVFHRNFGVERDIEIGYVGSVTGQKQRYFKAFEKSGMKITTNDRYLSYEEIGLFYSRCKLVYNVLARRDLNVRSFEASCAGAVVINQGWIDEGCETIFTEGENMVFHDFDDAPNVAKALLDDDEKRIRMGASAERLVMSGHTYRHRMKKALDIVSGGVTEERMRLRSGFLIPVAEGLTCQHPGFKWRRRAAENFRRAFGRSFFGTALYLVKYAGYRVFEKLEKLVWSMGKAPV